MGEKTGKEEAIQNLLEKLKDRGYDALRVAGLAEFFGKRPAIIHWEGSDVQFVPDIMARRKGQEFIFQVETAETWQNAECRQKISLFICFAEHFRQHFCLVVPAACRDAARRELLVRHADERHTHLIMYADGE